MPEFSTGSLIRNGQLETNPWVLYQPGSALPLAPPPDSPGWMVELSLWQACFDAFPARKHPIGIVLPTDADCCDLILDGAALQTRGDIAFIAIHFPHYGDGRGFSLAWMLREQYGWRGELRAIGDVLIDTVHYLARCGFTSFLPKPGHDAALALQALQTFSEHYQPGYTSQPTHARCE